MDEPIFLDSFQGRLRLEGVLETRTGLHIGAGSSGDPLATDAPVVRNAAGFPYIPGSSVKGVIRSAAEGLFPRIPSKEKVKPRLWTCDFLAQDPCVHPHSRPGPAADAPGRAPKSIRRRRARA